MRLYNFLFDSFCFLSLLGIWPRFIEPSLIQTTKHKIPIDLKDKDLNGLKIVQLSDLHLGKNPSSHFLKKILRKVDRLKPDLLVLTGDFIQNGKVENRDALTDFLKKCCAPLGCFAVLGNHDYEKYVGIYPDGTYGTKEPALPVFQLKNRFLKPQSLPTGSFSTNLKGIKPNQELLEILKSSGITLLHNEFQTLGRLTIFGVGEYCCGDVDERIYEDPKTFKLLLIHNPDGLKQFKDKKVDLALSGHTHNGQLNLPYIRKLFLFLEDGYQSGFFKVDDKTLYVNRGLGGTLPMRANAVPEITLFELEARDA